MTKIIFLCFILLPLVAFGDIDAGKFKINVSATQRGDSIEVSGRINSGPRCENLSISSRATSDQGHVITIFSSTKYSGWGSSLYDGKQKINLSSIRGFPSWTIIQTVATCND
jgi:hypothetical protein